jgi:hypothetical protein
MFKIEKLLYHQHRCCCLSPYTLSIVLFSVLPLLSVAAGENELEIIHSFANWLATLRMEPQKFIISRRIVLFVHQPRKSDRLAYLLCNFLLTHILCMTTSD